MSSNPITVRPVEEHLPPLAGEANPPKEQVDPATKARDLAHLLHDQPTGSSPSGTPLFTGGAKSAQDVNADYSYVLRQFFGNHGIGVTGRDSALFSAMGTTTSFNSIMGAIAAKGAYDRYQSAKQIGCGVFSHERVESGIDTVRGTVQSMAGSIYIPYRPLSITTSILGVNAGSFTAPTVLGQVTYTLGTIGGALFGIFYACLSGFFASTTARLASFSIKMWKASDSSNMSDVGNVAKIVQFLKDRLGVTASSTLEQIQKANNSDQDKVKAELKKAVIDSTCRFIMATLKEAVDQKMPGISKRSEKECRQMAENLLAQFDNLPEGVSKELSDGLIVTLKLEKAKAKDLSFVELLGLDIKTALRSKRDEAELSGYIGGAAVATLKRAMETDLITRLDSKDKVVQDKALEEAIGLIKEARSSMRWNGFINVGLLFAGVVGMIGTIMNFIPATANLAITGAIWLACAVAMLPVDGYCLFSSQNSDGQIGKYDKTLLYASMTLGAVSLTVTVLLGTIFSMGAAPLAIGIVIGLLWLGNSAYSFYKLEQKEQKHEIDHPTLDSMAKKLEEQIEAKSATERLAGKRFGNTDILERLKKKAKNLSSEDKKALKAEVADLAGIQDHAKRQTLKGRHGLALPKVSTIDLDQLQKELEDCLLNAPFSTLRILDEMDSGQDLKDLRSVLDKYIQDRSDVNRSEVLNMFKGLSPMLKDAVDKKIALVYGFGEMYFDQHAVDADVLRAVEKAYEGNRSSQDLRTLYDYLSVIPTKDLTKGLLIEKAKELFSKLSREDKALVTLNIYHKRAKKESSRQFAAAKLGDIKTALEAVKVKRNPDTARRVNLDRRLSILPLPKTA